MSDKNKLVTFETVNDLMLFKWGDGLESYINLKILREKCPCANCEGEKDVFGNFEVPLKKVGSLVVPDAAEIKLNNRARSAKLRIAEALNPNI